MKLCSSIILGHTQCGKSPLGDYIERHASTEMSRFFHLDFGQHLRDIAAGRINAGLHHSDVELVRLILDGTLLGPENFHIAQAIFDFFITRHKIDSSRDIIILNGFPRTIAQACFAEKCGISAGIILNCVCSAETAFKRKVCADIGQGFEDRSNRSDNDYATFQKKIESFQQVTQPLIRYYIQNNAPMCNIDVYETTSPDDMFGACEEALKSLAERVRASAGMAPGPAFPQNSL